MKIAISTSGQDLNSSVDPRFGRAKGFIVFDTISREFEYVDNKQNLNAAQGAGIQSGKIVSDTGAEVVITGHCGPKAFMTLKTAGIKVYTGAQGSVQNAIDMFEKEELVESHVADVQGHWM